jgi:hypothetical protein
MREFGASIMPELEQQIRLAADRLFETAKVRRPTYGRDFAMEDRPDELVAEEVDVRLDEDERYRLARTVPSARPPFEWQYEITADMGESEYIKHYLIRDHDIVLAQRKVLTPIDDEEGRLMLADLQAVLRHLAG